MSSIAKGMRLHILGPNFEREPPRDAGYPAGKTLYAREMSARALHALAFWDQVIGCVESDTAGFTLDPHPFRFPRGMSSVLSGARYIIIDRNRRDFVAVRLTM